VNWRVVLPLGIVLAVVLGGVGVWLNQRLVATPYRQCLPNPITAEQQLQGVKPTRYCFRNNHYTTYHHEATLAWYGSASIVAITLASLPLMMQRERRRRERSAAQA
jgi:hypothetical protein